MYKQDLVLNNPQWLICHKTNQIKPKNRAENLQIFRKYSFYCFNAIS